MTSSVEASAPMGTGDTKVDADGLADLDELDDLDIPLGGAELDDLADLEDLEDLEDLNAAPSTAGGGSVGKSPAPVASLISAAPTPDDKP